MKTFFLFITLSIWVCTPLSSLTKGWSHFQIQTAEETKSFNNGYGYILSGEYKKAIDTFSIMDKRFPKSTYMDRVNFWQAWAHTELKNYGVALKLYQKVVNEFNKSAYMDDALYKIGEIYETYLRDYDKAIAAYKKLLGPMGPDQLPTHNTIPAQQRIAQINQERNLNFSQALKDWQGSQSMSLNQNQNLTKSNNYFFIQAQKRIDFIQANSSNDFLPLSRYTTAQICSREGKFLEAIKIFKQIEEEFPGSPLVDNAFYEIALCYRKLNKNKKAIKYLRFVIKKYPESEIITKVKQLLHSWTSQ